MHQHTKVFTAVLSVLGSSMALSTFQAQAQTAPQSTERIEITGSSIKRVDSESALPIQVLTAADIKRAGVTTVTDLIQTLPAMQGFTTASQSVNGGGGGATTAALHSLAARYTLVLLNGRRLAPYTTGATVNLNSLPLSAIERVEVLTDGASALYGSDAIAGVVNFITRRDSTAGDLSASVYIPQKSGGGSATASVSKGFGDLSTDKFNVLISASYDKQEALEAKQREFSKTGLLKFYDQGAEQSVDFVSSNTVPGNARAVVLDRNGPDGKPIRIAFNPFLAKTGACPEGSPKVGLECRYDFPSTVQSIPESERYSLFGSARFQPTESISLFTELAFSRFFNTPRYAPPAQPGLPLPQSIIESSINPYLAQLGYAGAKAVSANVNIRLADAGGRQDKYQTDATHFVLGADGSFAGIDLTGTFTHSANKQTDTALSGYSSLIAFNALVASGKWNPLLAPAGTSVDIVSPIVLRQVLDVSKSSIDVLSIRGSTALAKLPGGDLGVGFGADYTKQKYSDDPSAILQGANALQPNYADAIVGGGGGALPFDSTRNSYGLFTELQVPVIKGLEVTASARFDSYGAVSNSRNFDVAGNPISAATQGTSNSSGTYKLGLRFQPIKEVLVRGSIGTGFKVPTLADITAPLASGGSTGFQKCPPGLSAAKAALCATTGQQEYNIQSGGNPASDVGGLKPEKSTQWTVGFRVEPAAFLSFGADLWTVQLKDQIDTITENTAFSDGAKYETLFKVAPDPVTQTPTLTFLSVPINTGKAYYSGIDFDAESKVSVGIGKLTSRFRGTYMIRADYQTPGTPGFINNMQKIGSDGKLTSRYLLNASFTLDTGAISNTVAVSHRPGYMDEASSYCQTDAAGDCLKYGADDRGRRVNSLTTWDWQGRFDFSKEASITLGIKNLFDAKPPFSLIDAAGTGNVRGYDPRYADPIGRQFYLSGNYKF
jgi:iron complex outermembrane recepter protein